MPKDTTYEDHVGDVMLITRSYVMDHRTLKGSWTRDQLVSLGVEYPPKAGWLNAIIGTEISKLSAARFESAIFAKRNKAIRLSPSALKKADMDVLKGLLDKINTEVAKRERIKP